MAVTPLTFDQLAALWVDAGGPRSSAATAAAIALAESSGCPYALAGPADVRPEKVCVYRHTLSENSFGLWQINVMAQLILAMFAVDLFDPRINAQHAVQISANGTDFSPWSTYLSGAWRQYLQQPQPPGGFGVPVTPPAPPAPAHPNEQVFYAWGRLTLALGQHLPARLHAARSLGGRLRGLLG